MHLAQLDAFEERDGWRYQCLATDTAVGQLALLDARHRAHARVEDRIRCGKDTGLGRFPSRTFAINAAWLTAVMLAVDLISWTQTILLHDHPALAKVEPKTLRYRLLHAAARLGRSGRRLRLRLRLASPVGQALDLPWTRRRLQAELGLAGSPQMVLRFGHALPFGSASPRRRVSEVLDVRR